MLYVDPTASSATLQAGGQANDAVRKQAALQELDQLFVFQLLQEMRKSIPTDGLLNAGGMAQDTYNEMLDDAMAADMAKSGQFSVSQQITEQWKAMEAQRKDVPVSGFLPLHPEAQPIRFNASMPGQAGFSGLPLRSFHNAVKAYSLIKAPLKLADN